MLSIEDNERLTKIGPGTPMGNLMRRYWQPIAAAKELEESPTKQVRLMGEDLVLYRDKAGAYGMLDLHCPHRRADLSYGMVEERGLRCNYHGWAYDEKGNCISQPFEDIAHPEANFKEKIKIKAYPVKEKAGLLWAYMGPDPVPELWDWDIFNEIGYKSIVFSPIPCNWLQCAENDIDPVHFEWLHANWTQHLRGERNPETRLPTHLKIDFEDFEWGIEYKRLVEGQEEWQIGRVALWPNALYVTHFEWRVPVDDHNTLSVCWNIDRLPGDEPFEQPSVPYFWSPITDPVTGRWITSHTVNQDIVAWVGQGAVSDRENEHLGASDAGVIMLRRQFMNDLKAIEEGRDPKGILRDPERNHSLYLPRNNGTQVLRGNLDQGVPRRSVPSGLYHGVPQWMEEEIAQAYASRTAQG